MKCYVITVSDSRTAETDEGGKPIADAFGREITYHRVSVGDRCDLRCIYCRAGAPTLSPSGTFCASRGSGRRCG